MESFDSVDGSGTFVPYSRTGRPNDPVASPSASHTPVSLFKTAEVAAIKEPNSLYKRALHKERATWYPVAVCGFAKLPCVDRAPAGGAHLPCPQVDSPTSELELVWLGIETDLRSHNAYLRITLSVVDHYPQKRWGDNRVAIQEQKVVGVGMLESVANGYVVSLGEAIVLVVLNDMSVLRILLPQNLRIIAGRCIVYDYRFVGRIGDPPERLEAFYGVIKSIPVQDYDGYLLGHLALCVCSWRQLHLASVTKSR